MEAIVLQRIERKVDALLRNRQGYYKKPSSRQRRVNFTPLHELSSSFKRTDQTFEDPHQVVIREHFCRLVRGLDLANTLLLDKFYQDDALSSSDMESLNKTSGQKRSRLFMMKLQRYSPERFEKFLDLLQIEHGDLAETLRRDFEKKKLLKRQWYCLSCKIEKDVDLNDIIDFLYQERIICLNDMDEVLNNKNWILLKRCVNTSVNTFEIFVSSLSIKYGHLASELKKQTKLQCICSSINAEPYTDSSSDTESLIEESVASMKCWTKYERRGLVRHATFYQRKRVLSGLCRHESLLKRTVMSKNEEIVAVPSKSFSFPSLKSMQPTLSEINLNFSAQTRSIDIAQSTSSFPFYNSSLGSDTMVPDLPENSFFPCRSHSSPNLNKLLPRRHNENQFILHSGSFKSMPLMEISENIIESFQTEDDKPQVWNEDIKEESIEINLSLPECTKWHSTVDSDNESIVYQEDNNLRRSLRRNTAMRYSKEKAGTIREKYFLRR